MTDKIVVLNMCGSAEEAEALARKLIDLRLAACITVIPQVNSFYRWNGAVTSATEWLLMIKTSRPLFVQLKAALESASTYEVPEVIALPVIEGSSNYLSWLDNELAGGEVTNRGY